MPIPPADKGKCATCGFLGLRHAENFDHPLVQECGPTARRTGSAYGVQGFGYALPVYKTEPCCFRGMVDFRVETGQEHAAIEEPNHPARLKARDAFAKPRDCKKWWPYREGLSPQEHYQEVRMYLIERLRKEQREWFEKERIAREKHEREMESQVEARERESDRRLTLRLTLAGIIVAILCTTPDSLWVRSIYWVWGWFK